MARPRIYDEDAVIDKALWVFWQKGFSGTSSRDLLAATGMSNGSLFNSFGDKATLYLACLQKYDDIYVATLQRLLLSEIPFKEKIKKALQGTAKKIPGTGDYAGCFFFNSSVDSGIHDDAITTLTAAIQMRLEMAFRTAADLAKEKKELPIKSDSNQIAQYLMMVITGLRALVKANTPAAQLAHVIHSTLHYLPF
jgi:TetR/AcrR family transcriptional regulator, transcriptional repressor for nem operon